MEKSDTLYIRDTITRYEPVSVLNEVIRIDTIHDVFIDRVHDTVWIEVPIERKVYEDSLYRAVITGYHPVLESISVYPQTIYINSERIISASPQKWSLGFSAGPSALVTPSGRIYAGLGVTAGVRYRF